jgi:hypothetical protein
MVDMEIMLATIKDGSKTAIRLATNEVLKGVRTDAVKEIDAKVTLKPTIIREHFTLNNMTVASLRASVDCRGDPLPLIYYGATSVVKGVKVKILARGTKDLVKHAFIATLGSTHRGVFWRSTRRAGIRPSRFPVGKRTKVPSPQKRSGEQILGGESTFQLPIHELYGPRVPDIFDDNDIMDLVLRGANLRFQKRLYYHTNRLIEKAR